jgi:hypothetical protein
MTTAEVSIPAYLAVIFICIFFVSAFIVVYYAEEGFPYLTYITLTVGYFSSFAILFLVPLDIAVVVTDRRSVFAVNDPTYMNHVQTLSIAYSTFFNLILIFGSFVLVLEEYYNTDGMDRKGIDVNMRVRLLMVTTFYVSTIRLLYGGVKDH